MPVCKVLYLLFVVMSIVCVSGRSEEKRADRLGSFLVLGDWGYDAQVHGNVKEGCQRAIAKAMRAQALDLGDVQFVINVGDSFYPDGVANQTDPKWSEVWLDVYGNLTSLPWFSVYGNHDYNGRDRCACQLDTSGCAQVNPGVGNWVMPDLNYYDGRYLEEFQLEIVGLDLNTMWSKYTCEYTPCPEVCPAVLKQRSVDALQLMTTRSQESPANKMIVFSHYPTDYFDSEEPWLPPHDDYSDLLRQLRDDRRHIQYFGGHRHNVDHENTTSIAPNVNWLVGGGGGWSCDGSQQGFVVGEIFSTTMRTHPVLVPTSACCPDAFDTTAIT